MDKLSTLYILIFLSTTRVVDNFTSASSPDERSRTANQRAAVLISGAKERGLTDGGPAGVRKFLTDSDRKLDGLDLFRAGKRISDVEVMIWKEKA